MAYNSFYATIAKNWRNGASSFGSGVHFGMGANYNEYYGTLLEFRASIPQGSTVTSADISFPSTITNLTYLHPLRVRIHVGNWPSVQMPTSVSSATSFSSIDIDWSNVESWVSGDIFSSPAITTAINTLINRSTWVSGGSVIIAISFVSCDAYNNDRLASAAILNVTWTPPENEPEPEPEPPPEPPPPEPEPPPVPDPEPPPEPPSEYPAFVSNSVLTLNPGDYGFSEDIPEDYHPLNWVGEVEETVITETIAMADSITAQVTYGEIPADYEGELDEHLTTADYFYAELPGDTEDPKSGHVGESFRTSALIEAETPYYDLDEDVELSEAIDVETPYRELDEGVELSDEISVQMSEWQGDLAEDVTTSDSIVSPVEADLDEEVTQSEAISGYRQIIPSPFIEKVTSAEAITATVDKGASAEDELSIHEAVSIQWNLTVAESITISETVTEELGWMIEEVLSMQENVSSLWTGTETIEDMLEIWGKVLICSVFNETAAETLEVTDTSTFVHQMISTVAEALGITEVVTPAMTFNPVIVEALGVIAAVTAIRTMSFTNEEEIEVADVLSWQWQESVAESIEATDAPSLAFRAILALTENLELTETVLQTLMVDETLSDVLDIVASLTMQARLNVAVEDTLTIGLSVLLDGEVWECWVLSGNAFNPSVYSGFDFNSYATFGSSAWGAKDDGIYELTGDTDQGDAITPGIVLPATWFGTNRKKRFRKAYFGLVGGTTPAIRVETDSGSKTYTISDSKANLTRDMYGRQWVLKLQDFESLDFVTLWPVVLTR